MADDNLKQAFFKIKQDIFSIGEEMSGFKLVLEDLKIEIKLISSFINDLKLKLLENSSIISEKPVSIPATNNPEFRHIQPPNPTNSTDIPTDKLLSQLLKSQKTSVSIGNGGVPTDRQTDRQTNQHIIQHINLPSKQAEILPEYKEKESEIDRLEKVSEILDNLDALKKEVRRKFKALTSQEITVFSMLYSLESQGNQVDYPLLSTKLNLSESSIRDYILKIQKKGIPIIKEKLNNKRVILHISQDLKKIASLDTILKLREI